MFSKLQQTSWAIKSVWLWMVKEIAFLAVKCHQKRAWGIKWPLCFCFVRLNPSHLQRLWYHRKARVSRSNQSRGYTMVWSRKYQYQYWDQYWFPLGANCYSNSYKNLSFVCDLILLPHLIFSFLPKMLKNKWLRKNVVRGFGLCWPSYQNNAVIMQQVENWNRP